MDITLKQRPVDVLLVVSDIEGVRQIRRTLEEAEVNDRLHHIADMQEALAYLRQEKPYQNAPKPGLIILEAILSKQSDIDLLEEIKADPEFADISVVILAGVSSPTRLFENCLYSADTSVIEPISLPKLAEILGSTAD